jgi:MFS family permease
MSQNKAYIYLVLGLSFVYFIITNIQFWVSDYMMMVLKVDEKTVFFAFSLICITSPTMGSVTGGYVGHLIGGYQSKDAMTFVMICCLMAISVGLPIPFVDNFYLLSLLLWIYLFLGGCFMPILTGIMLNTVEPHHRTQANGLANLSYNLFGYLPAPYVYGIVCELTGGKESRWGLIATFAMNAGVLICMILAMFVHPDTKEAWREKKEIWMERRERLISNLSPRKHADRTPRIEHPVKIEIYHG